MVIRGKTLKMVLCVTLMNEVKGLVLKSDFRFTQNDNQSHKIYDASRRFPRCGCKRLLIFVFFSIEEINRYQRCHGYG
jgi:hypothetical protein